MTRTEYHFMLERTRYSQLLVRIAQVAQVAHCKFDIFYQPLTGRIVDGSRRKATINLVRIDVAEIDLRYLVTAWLWNEISREERGRQFGHKPFHECRLWRLSYTTR